MPGVSHDSLPRQGGCERHVSASTITPGIGCREGGADEEEGNESDFRVHAFFPYKYLFIYLSIRLKKNLALESGEKVGLTYWLNPCGDK